MKTLMPMPTVNLEPDGFEAGTAMRANGKGWNQHEA